MMNEKRWIVLTPDGGHVSIGRLTDPSDSEIEAVAQKLREAGTGGWLAIMEGKYYGPRNVKLLMVREIARTGITWESAARAFRERRARATSEGGVPPCI